jgi:hypothetical protein
MPPRVQTFRAGDIRAQEFRAHEFRLRAAECLALARRIRDLELKRLSQELARQWFELAERAEKSSRH